MGVPAAVAVAVAWGGGRVSAPAGYLTMFDFFRVAVCACVLGQHSFLWTDMSSNVVGTGFITMLHFTRNAFFFLSGLVVCYAQIRAPGHSGDSGRVATCKSACRIWRGP